MTGDLRIDRAVSASQSALWEACATPRGLEGWYADKVRGTLAPGSVVRLEWPGLRLSMSVDLTDWVPERRIAFRNGPTEVALEVTDGRVSLTHSGLAPRDDRDGFRASWRVALALLAQSVEAHPGRQRKPAWFIGRARTSARMAHVYFTEPLALSAWQARGQGVPAEGQTYSMTALSGDPMTGLVLVAEGGRDVALTWRETGDSVLVLRSLPSPGSHDERILAACWSRWVAPGAAPRGDAADANVKEVEAELERAVQRLARVLDRGGIA